MIRTNWKYQSIKQTTTYSPGESVYNLPVWRSYQSIDKLNRGHFIPGRFVVNPVIISKAAMGHSSGEVTYPYLIGGKTYYRTQSGPIGAIGITLTVSGPTGVTVFRNLPTSTQLEQLAYVQAVSKMNSSAFDGGIFLGELSETIQMLRNPLQGIVGLLGKKHFRDPRKLMKGSADQWMEFRYGIRPFIGDCASIVSLFDKRKNRNERLLNPSRSSTQMTYGWAKDQQVNVVSFSYLTHTRGSANLSYHAGCTYARLYNMSSTLHTYGLGVQDLPNVLWELTPLSFVADWFYNTGDWLRAITPNPSVHVLGSFLSRKTDEVTEHRIISATSYPDLQVTVGANGHANVHYQKLDRVTGLNLPVLPVRKISTLGLTRSIDAAILTMQRIPNAWKRMLSR